MVIGLTSAVMPKINAILVMLEPTALPRASRATKADDDKPD